MLTFLPQELVSIILTFLDVISLLHCKSVCKSWLSIISNPQFIQTHLIQSRQKQPSDMLKVIDKYIYVDTCETSTLVSVLPVVNWSSISLVCSCNGLVCVGNRNARVIYLGNPMTKQFKILPAPSQKLNCEEYILGFGFDDIANDYKILRISFPVVEVIDDDTVILALQPEMYSANDDSWKEIQVPETLANFEIVRTVCGQLKGSRVLYFEGRHELLSFDLHDEVFRVYPYPISPLPPELQFEDERKSFLLDFEGSVALIFNEYINDELVLSLWTLSNVLGNWSWTKEFNLDDDLKEIGITSLYLGDGQFLGYDHGEFIVFDYKKKHDRRFLPRLYPARTGPSPPRTGSIVNYNESLVSLKGFKQQE